MSEPKPPLDSSEAQHSDDPLSSSDPSDDGLVPSTEKTENGGIAPDSPRELKETECYDALAYSWPRWKKWTYLVAIAFVQVSMNFNTSVFPNAVIPLSKAFNISQQEARTGQMAYLVTYSIGCELWAPWSEEFGRWPILQLSMFLINIWQLPAALAPNWGSIVVARALGGISTAGGSVTLGLIADLYEPDEQQFPLAFIVFSSCIGTSIGGVIGGPIERCEFTNLLCNTISVLIKISNSPRLAVVLLDPAHLRSRHPSDHLLHARKSVDNSYRQRSKASPQDRRRPERVRTQRTQKASRLTQGSRQDLDSTLPHAFARAYRVVPISSLWILRCAHLHLSGELQYSLRARMGLRYLGLCLGRYSNQPRLPSNLHFLLPLVRERRTPSKETRQRGNPARASSQVAPLAGTLRADRSVRFCLDILRSRARYSMDRINDFLHHGRNRKLCHLSIVRGLHDRILWCILGFRLRW